MTSVPTTTIGYDFSADPLAAQNKVNAAQLQAVLVDLYTQKNALLTALLVSVRDDNTLTDALVRLRNLHAEVTLTLQSAAGWQLRQGCVAASTGNVTIANPGVSAFDGRTVVVGDRVLLRAQTAGAENGPYVFNGSGVAMTRTTDCDTSAEILLAAVPVYYGTLYGQSLWIMNTPAVVLGTTAQTWVEIALVNPAIISPGTMHIESFADGVDFTAGTTTFLTLNQNPGSTLNTDVRFDGVAQHISSYSLAGAVMTFDAPIPFGVQKVEIRHMSTVPMAALDPLSVATSNLQLASVGLAQLKAEVTSKLLPLAALSVGTAELVDASVTPAKLSAASLALFSAAVPIGALMPYAGAVAPSAQFMIPQGQSLVRTDYPDLFIAIGTVYGSVDGTHFTLPDLRGRAPIGAGTGAGLTARAAGTNYGTETTVLTKANVPPHTHRVAGDPGGPGGGVGINFTTGSHVNTDDGSTDGLGAAGVATGHSNMQPVLGMNYLIRVL